MRVLLTCILVICVFHTAFAAETVVLGHVVKNEPMTYVPDTCPKDDICLQTWWKWVIGVDQTVSGTKISGHVVAARMQHTSWLRTRLKQLHMFVLMPIDDIHQRELLKANYYLEDFASISNMYCLYKDPKDIGITTDDTYVTESDDPKKYCFELSQTE